MPTYIYAITAADHPLRLDGLSGVGDPAAELRTVRTKELERGRQRRTGGPAGQAP